MGIAVTVEMTKTGVPRLGQVEHRPGDPSSQVRGEAVFPWSQRGALAARVLAFSSHTHPQLISTRKSSHPAIQREQ